MSINFYIPIHGNFASAEYSVEIIPHKDIQFFYVCSENIKLDFTIKSGVSTGCASMH